MMQAKFYKQNKKGFTLIELIVGMGIFSMVMLSVTGIFQQVVNVQRKAIGAHNVQESLRYVLEMMSKEIRTAERNFDTCVDIPSGQIYNVDNGTLYLKNQYNECVAYFLENNRLKIARDGVTLFVTPDEVFIDYLNFYHKTVGQEAVTITIGIRTLDISSSGSSLTAQTTISSRYYLEDKIL